MSDFTPLGLDFYNRPVEAVARGLIGKVLKKGKTSGVIVETEAYHQREPACHAYVGLTNRTRPLFGPPGNSYVYFSYGVHNLFNAVAEEEGIGAAVLVRAIEPLEGIEIMMKRRGLQTPRNLGSGPGKLAQALDIKLEDNDLPLDTGPIQILNASFRSPKISETPRIGISKAKDLLWRYCDTTSECLSKPYPKV